MAVTPLENINFGKTLLSQFATFRTRSKDQALSLAFTKHFYLFIS